MNNVAAVEVDDLYQANVVVDSQTRVKREQAIEAALAAVFLKVGGKQSLLTHRVLKTAKKNANSYVSQYRYQRNNDGQLSLVVLFNEAKVNQLFKTADLALWGSLRPQILLWLIDEQGTTRTIITTDADSIIPSDINTFSIKRGLPIVMPLMDLTDNQQVTLADFWYYSHQQVQQASLSYLADMVVVMRVSDSSLVSDNQSLEHSTTERSTQDSQVASSPVIANTNTACDLLCQQQANMPKVLDWRMYTQGVLYTQQYQGLNKASLITQGLNDITELIYQSYALSTTAENNFIIEVQNITSLKSDTEVANFLINLSAVKAVTLTRVQGDARHFKLELIGSKDSFIASLKLNNKLTQKIDTQIDSQTDTQNAEQYYLNNMNTQTASGTNKSDQSMKIIVLGDNSAAVNNVTEQVADDINRDTVQPSQPLNNFDEDNDIYTDAESEQNILTQQVIPQIITPTIPVFYWEQG